MATVLDLFPVRVAFVDMKTGRLTPEAVRALNVAFLRMGGASGPSTSDLAIADDEDSGLEEFKAEVTKALDGLAAAPLPDAVPLPDDQAPPLVPLSVVEEMETQISALREEVARLQSQINDLQQGTTL